MTHGFLFMLPSQYFTIQNKEFKKKKKNTLTVYRLIYAVLYIHKRREKGIMFLVGEKKMFF